MVCLSGSLCTICSRKCFKTNKLFSKKNNYLHLSIECELFINYNIYMTFYKKKIKLN